MLVGESEYRRRQLQRLAESNLSLSVAPVPASRELSSRGAREHVSWCLVKCRPVVCWSNSTNTCSNQSTAARLDLGRRLEFVLNLFEHVRISRIRLSSRAPPADTTPAARIGPGPGGTRPASVLPLSLAGFLYALNARSATARYDSA